MRGTVVTTYSRRWIVSGIRGNLKPLVLIPKANLLIINVAEAHQYNGLMDISASVDSDRGLSANLYLEKQNLFTEELSGSLSVELSKYDQYIGDIFNG